MLNLKSFIGIFLSICFFLNSANAEFITIKSAKTNVRTGPGKEYPIKFTYTKRNIPVKVLHIFEDWYQIQDIDNDIGWINKNLTSKKVYGITKSLLFGYKKSSENSELVAKIDGRVILFIKKCKEDWCYSQNGKHKFYVKKDLIWEIE
jgi:SH3-like domain-containing protein